MLKWLKKLVKQLWSLFKKLLPLIIIAGVALFFLNPALFATIISTAGSWCAAIPGLVSGAATWVIGLFNGLSFWEGVAAIVGAAFLLDPEGTTAAISDAVSTVGGVVADVVGEVTEAVATSLFSSPLFWIAAGVGVYMLFSDSDDEEKLTSSSSYPPQRGGYNG